MLKTLLFINYCGVKVGPRANDAEDTTAWFMQAQIFNFLLALCALIIGIIPFKLPGLVVFLAFFGILFISFLFKKRFKRIIHDDKFANQYKKSAASLKKRYQVLSYFLFFGSLAFLMLCCFTFFSDYSLR